MYGAQFMLSIALVPATTSGRVAGQKHTIAVVRSHAIANTFTIGLMQPYVHSVGGQLSRTMADFTAAFFFVEAARRRVSRSWARVPFARGLVASQQA